MPPLEDVLAANVRAERARRRWSQEQLAGLLGTSDATVSDIERGKRQITAADLPRLCRAFGVSLVKLLEGADVEDIEALRISELT